MSFSRRFKHHSAKSDQRGPRGTHGGSDTRIPDEYDDHTASYYSRRNDLLSGIHHADWWMAIAVLLLAAGIGFVVL